jgi:hypothetical protein
MKTYLFISYLLIASACMQAMDNLQRKRKRNDDKEILDAKRTKTKNYDSGSKSDTKELTIENEKQQVKKFKDICSALIATFTDYDNRIADVLLDTFKKLLPKVLKSKHIDISTVSKAIIACNAVKKDELECRGSGSNDEAIEKYYGRISEHLHTRLAQLLSNKYKDFDFESDPDDENEINFTKIEKEANKFHEETEQRLEQAKSDCLIL